MLNDLASESRYKLIGLLAGLVAVLLIVAFPVPVHAAQKNLVRMDATNLVPATQAETDAVLAARPHGRVQSLAATSNTAASQPIHVQILRRTLFDEELTDGYHATMSLSGGALSADTVFVPVKHYVNGTEQVMKSYKLGQDFDGNGTWIFSIGEISGDSTFETEVQDIELRAFDPKTATYYDAYAMVPSANNLLNMTPAIQSVATDDGLTLTITGRFAPSQTTVFLSYGKVDPAAIELQPDRIIVRLYRDPHFQGGLWTGNILVSVDQGGTTDATTFRSVGAINNNQKGSVAVPR